MNRHSNMTHAMLAAVLAVTSLSVFARDPQSNYNPSLTPAPMLPHVGSLTPPPKEWAMFPEDPPAQAPQKGGQSGGQNATGGSTGTGGSGNSATGGLVSAPNLRAHGPQKDLPLFWMILTSALSLGALAACGSLILQKSAAELADAGDDTPIVPEELEIKA